MSDSPEKTTPAADDFERIVCAAPLGVVLSQAGKIVFVNSFVTEWTGLSAAELIGTDPSLLAGRADRERVQDRLRAAERGEPMGRSTYEVAGSTGSRWIEVHSVPLLLRGQPGAATFVRDVSGQVRAESDLRSIATQHQQVLDTSPYAVVITREGNIVYCNAPFERVTKSAPGSLLGRTLLDFAPPDDRPLGIARLKEAASGKEVPWRKGTLVQSDGTHIDIEVQSEPLQHDSQPSVLTRLLDISEKRVAEQLRAETEERYSSLIESLPDGILVHRDFEVAFANAALKRMVGLAESTDVRGSRLENYLTPDSLANARRRAEAMSRGETTTGFEFFGRRVDGSIFPVEVTSQLTAYEGRPAIQTVVRDLTARKASERSQAALFRIAQASSKAESLDELLRSVHSIVGELMDARNFFVAIADPSAETFTFPYFVNEREILPASVPVAQSLSGHVLRTGTALLTGRDETEALRKEGVPIQGVPPVSWIGVPLKTRNATFGVLVVQSYQEEVRFDESHRDLLTFVSGHIAEAIERQKQEDRIQHLAYHDPLTGLPNRLLFEDRLRHAIYLSSRRSSPLAVIFVDLDRFKIINDSLGHPVGDEVLKVVARRLGSSLRDGDTLARRGGDEFLVLLPDTPAAGAAKVAEKIIDVLRSVIHLSGHDLSVSGSCGIAVFPDNGTDVESLLKSSDIAMYRAKEAGRDAYRLFNPEMNEAARRRLTLETGLRRALADRKLEPYFQPIVDTATGRIVAGEALLRWRLNDQETIPPKDFIGVAEQSGLIVSIGASMLRVALRHARDWPLWQGHEIPLAINLAARQIQDALCVEMILNALREETFPPSRLQLEVTESSELTEDASAVDRLRRLRDAGVSIAIDDFGVGYSSLSRLRRLPFDTLKIDASFIKNVTTDPDDGSVATAVIHLGKNLGLNVIAEGVETTEQRAYLESHGCTRMQGFLFSPALPQISFCAWLERRDRRATAELNRPR